MTDKTNIDSLIQQDDLLQELMAILEQTDKSILIDMIRRLATLAADAEQPETIEEFAYMNSRMIAAFYAASAAAGGRGPSEAVLKALGIEGIVVSDK